MTSRVAADTRDVWDAVGVPLCDECIGDDAGDALSSMFSMNTERLLTADRNCRRSTTGAAAGGDAAATVSLADETGTELAVTAPPRCMLLL